MSTDRYGSWRYLLSFSGINYLQAGISAALTFLLVQFLSIQTFADYRLGVVCMGIVSTVGLFGADRSLVTELNRSSNLRDTVGAYLLIRFFVATLTLLVVGAFALISGAASPSLVLIFSLAGALMALRSPGWFDFSGRLRQHAMLMLSERTLTFLLCAAAVAWWQDVRAGDLGILIFFSILTVLMTELRVVEVNIGLRDLSASNVIRKAHNLLHRQKWVWYLTLSNLLLTFVSQFALYTKSADYELAYLGIAMQFAMIAMLFMQQLARLRGPKIAELTANNRTKDTILSNMRKMIVPILVSGICMGVLMGIISNFILLFFFDGRYAPAIYVNWVLMAWVTVFGVGLLVNRFVIGLNLQARVLAPSLVWSFMCLILVFFLSDNYGAFGYAWILFGCHAGSILSQFGILRYHLRVRLETP